MPYNPAGLFSLVASYFANPGTTIRTEQHNPVFEDVASALSSVLLRDGRAPMTGPLNMNGFPINNVVAGNSPSSVATLAQAMPIGAVIDYALKTPPGGWLLCTAQILLSSTPYQTLRTLLINDGFPYGQDGSGNPKLPDARGCVTAAPDAMGGVAAGRLTTAFLGVAPDLGAFGGAQSRTLGTANLPAVSYNLAGVTDPVNVTTNLPVVYNSTTLGFNKDNTVQAWVPGASGVLSSTGSFTPRGTVGPLGASSAFGVVQPTLVLNKIIRVSYDV